MVSLANKRVLVLGLGASGQAAAELLLRRGARVVAIDGADTGPLRQTAAALERAGARVELGAAGLPAGEFALAVLSPGVPCAGPWVAGLRGRGVPVIGELELGYQQSLCLNVAITGTNGKTTTTEMVERMLTHAGRKTVAAGNIGLPLCAVADRTRDLDVLTLEVSSFQLETIEYFRPAVAVLLNVTPDHLDRYAGLADYGRAKGRLFLNQQVFDWAIVQSEALVQMRALGVAVKAKVITFSARDTQADLYLDRGLIIGRLAEWAGPLLDMDHCRVRGPHNAENLMAALAVGRVLRVPWEQIVEALKAYAPAPHRCELVAEVGGVKFVNDSKATNLDAVQQALVSLPAGPAPGPNVWLIAGGKDKGFDFHDLGPLLARRVKGAFVLGETREKLRAAWGLFTPCTPVDSLLEAVTRAARNALPGDVVLLSPACSSFDMFQNYRHRGEVFREAVRQWARAGQEPGASRGAPDAGAGIHPAAPARTMCQ
ncbi:MAG: UDP-N-acetylmuramoyl-L-alanine--D-glutamate ligase [Verrucomicrobia bacterium]|nr:UDP-N-acetylmuramoyl-L-alanine--D-glutamate ligase [Verrucomicrobiota bacterium]